MMTPDTYLQIISILMAVIAVALPIAITLTAFVYLKGLKERVDDLAFDLDELWNRVENPPKNQSAP